MTSAPIPSRHRLLGCAWIVEGVLAVASAAHLAGIVGGARGVNSGGALITGFLALVTLVPAGLLHVLTGALLLSGSRWGRRLAYLGAGLGAGVVLLGTLFTGGGWLIFPLVGLVALAEQGYGFEIPGLLLLPVLWLATFWALRRPRPES